MINSLNIKNFTEFSEAKFDFSKGLDEELAMFDREQEAFYARQEGK